VGFGKCVGMPRKGNFVCVILNVKKDSCMRCGKIHPFLTHNHKIIIMPKDFHSLPGTKIKKVKVNKSHDVENWVNIGIRG